MITENYFDKKEKNTLIEDLVSSIQHLESMCSFYMKEIEKRDSKIKELYLQNIQQKKALKFFSVYKKRVLEKYNIDSIV